MINDVYFKNKRCWNKKCSHRGKLRIRNTGKVQDKSKLKDDEKEIVLLNPEEFFQQESLFSDQMSISVQFVKVVSVGPEMAEQSYRLHFALYAGH
mgnify:CR=1 FL=1